MSLWLQFMADLPPMVQLVSRKFKRLEELVFLLKKKHAATWHVSGLVAC